MSINVDSVFFDKYHKQSFTKADVYSFLPILLFTYCVVRYIEKTYLYTKIVSFKIFFLTCLPSNLSSLNFGTRERNFTEDNFA